MNRHRCHRVGSPPGPRGVLLLLVLISLSLFLLLGVALLVNATRSRMAARTFGTATDELEAYNDRAALDEALLVLLRGSQNAPPPQISESILADRYGADADLITTAVPSLAGWPNSPVLTATVAGGTARHNGRVLTLVPLRPGDGDTVSFRILGARADVIYLSNVPSRPGRVLPTGTCRWLVNGRDFAGTFPANEPWDGFTTGSAVGVNNMSDPWLTRVELNAGAVAAVHQATYQSSANGAATPPWNRLPLECDNDNDGVLDGVWINGTSGFLAPRLSPRGGRITQRVSYLVLDLDGRLNVNAAGMAAPAAGSYAGSRDVPLGMGYGPADVDASLLFPATLPASTGLSAFTGAGASPSGTWWGVLVGGSATKGPPSAAPPRPRPGIGAFSGRYGPNRVPGVLGDDAGAFQNSTAYGYPSVVSGTNAFADIKGHSRVYMSATVSGTANSLTPTLTSFLPASGTDATDDPYEIRLDAHAPRLGGNVRPSAAAGANDDLPFTVGELERVLRANDPDAAALAQRLAAALGSTAQASRLLITTDSWDTPAVTGSAALLIENALATRPPTYPWAESNAWSPEVAAGLRFDINRPVLSGSQQQEFCKGLYTLVRTLGETDARRAAQWAVNVLDFRDPDSTMTRFVYDSDLSDGWSVSGSTTGTVWGVERPEMVIADTASWRTGTGASGTGAMFVSVVRTPFAAARIASGVSTAVERLDPVLRSGTGWLDARLAVGGTSSVWQLRFGFHVTLTATINAGSSVVALLPSGTVLPTAQLSVGMLVTGTGMQLDTRIQSIDSPTQVTLTKAATETGTAVPLTFTEHPGRAVVFRPLSGSASQSPQWFVDGLQSPPQSWSRSMTFLGNTSGLHSDGMSPTGRASTWVISGTTASNVVNNSELRSPPSMLVNQGGTFALSGSVASGTGTLWLERLADPSRPNAADNPYIVVDTAPVESVSGTNANSAITQRRRRPGPRDGGAAPHPLAAFWRQPTGRDDWIADSGRTITTGTNSILFQLYYHSAGMLASGSSEPVPWFHWPNRPFVSPAELALVPADDANGMLRNYSLPTTSLVNGAIGHRILDATIVPSRFAGNVLTLTGIAGTAADRFAAIGLDRLPTWREPGRMNVNTMPTGTAAQTDGLLWQMLVGGTQTLLSTGTVRANPFTATGTADPSPARSLRQMQSLSGIQDGPPAIESIPTLAGPGTLHPRGKNPFLAMFVANRLANMATIRSNVFAVWITVETTDSSPGAPPPVTRRLFTIIDRSVPVGYSRGEDLNVRDTIRLLRQLD